VEATSWDHTGEARLDREWMKLIKEAKKAGLTVEDVREFLAEQRESTSVAAPLHKTGTNRRDNCWT